MVTIDKKPKSLKKVDWFIGCWDAAESRRILCVVESTKAKAVKKAKSLVGFGDCKVAHVSWLPEGEKPIGKTMTVDNR